ncbi:hypothetical protein HDU96_000833 [Phlyctochytrium bullatum]|nr:hypothetical protein HDU96_000833 [Phlyctochytrium bullatum]
MASELRIPTMPGDFENVRFDSDHDCEMVENDQEPSEFGSTANQTGRRNDDPGLSENDSEVSDAESLVAAAMPSPVTASKPLPSRTYRANDVMDLSTSFSSSHLSLSVADAMDIGGGKFRSKGSPQVTAYQTDTEDEVQFNAPGQAAKMEDDAANVEGYTVHAVGNELSSSTSWQGLEENKENFGVSSILSTFTSHGKAEQKEKISAGAAEVSTLREFPAQEIVNAEAMQCSTSLSSSSATIKPSKGPLSGRLFGNSSAKDSIAAPSLPQPLLRANGAGVLLPQTSFAENFRRPPSPTLSTSSAASVRSRPSLRKRRTSANSSTRQSELRAIETSKDGCMPGFGNFGTLVSRIGRTFGIGSLGSVSGWGKGPGVAPGVEKGARRKSSSWLKGRVRNLAGGDRNGVTPTQCGKAVATSTRRSGRGYLRRVLLALGLAIGTWAALVVVGAVVPFDPAEKGCAKVSAAMFNSNESSGAFEKRAERNAGAIVAWNVYCNPTAAVRKWIRDAVSEWDEVSDMDAEAMVDTRNGLEEGQDPVASIVYLVDSTQGHMTDIVQDLTCMPSSLNLSMSASAARSLAGTVRAQLGAAYRPESARDSGNAAKGKMKEKKTKAGLKSNVVETDADSELMDEPTGYNEIADSLDDFASSLNEVSDAMLSLSASGHTSSRMIHRVLMNLFKAASPHLPSYATSAAAASTSPTASMRGKGQSRSVFSVLFGGRKEQRLKQHIHHHMPSSGTAVSGPSLRHLQEMLDLSLEAVLGQLEEVEMWLHQVREKSERAQSLWRLAQRSTEWEAGKARARREYYETVREDAAAAAAAASAYAVEPGFGKLFRKLGLGAAAAEEREQQRLKKDSHARRMLRRTENDLTVLQNVAGELRQMMPGLVKLDSDLKLLRNDLQGLKGGIGTAQAVEAFHLMMREVTAAGMVGDELGLGGVGGVRSVMHDKLRRMEEGVYLLRGQPHMIVKPSAEELYEQRRTEHDMLYNVQTGSHLGEERNFQPV